MYIYMRKDKDCFVLYPATKGEPEKARGVVLRGFFFCIIGESWHFFGQQESSRVVCECVYVRRWLAEQPNCVADSARPH